MLRISSNSIPRELCKFFLQLGNIKLRQAAITVLVENTVDSITDQQVQRFGKFILILVLVISQQPLSLPPVDVVM